MTPTASIRPPAVAGMFYPGSARELSGDLAAMLGEAHPPALTPKALIVPHAGYVYSGPVAATAYALLSPLRDRIRRVVLLGPTHRVAVRGIAVPSVAAFATPLGVVAVDREAIASLAGIPQVGISDAAHAQEHSLEVHLPFLQTVLGRFALVPLAVGLVSSGDVAVVLERLWGGDETLIVISSDLSHYHGYEAARRLDRDTADRILRLENLEDHDQACGATPINGLLQVARHKGLAPTLLDLRNSGDTAGDRARVVGYCSVCFTEAGHDR
ncbi:MAG TPA: AmmeMemoRadiSam system protein B [Rhodocyclaceae bacterium]|nr:AmmeMemoRadiSam system protein B [Rhodocyclaceae bacterium]